jgi:hypothetical protein
MSNPAIRFDTFFYDRKMSQAGNRRVCKAPGAGSYRAKKGATELASAVRRIKASLAAAAADPSPVLPPTTQDAPLAALGPDGMLDADPVAPAHVAFHVPVMLPVLPNYGD